MTDPAWPHPVTGELFASPVPPGTGWPGDPATADTQVARSPADVTRLAPGCELGELSARISVCRACPRLVAWREQVATEKRSAFAAQPYWGRPVPGWGDPRAWLVIVGLAPAANGANRTGRLFTGDRSGDWLLAAMHRAGLATRPESEHAGDGQELVGVRMVATVRCAPPANKPTIAERDACAPWLAAELAALPAAKVLLCLGAYGWESALRQLAAAAQPLPRPRPKFGHGATIGVGDLTVLGCYHPSQHNTFTGRLTPQMLDEIFAQAAAIAGRGA